MNERIGYPEFIQDPVLLDKKYERVNDFFFFFWKGKWYFYPINSLCLGELPYDIV